MGDVLLKESCGAGHQYDMVGLKFGPYRVLLYYQTAFSLAAQILTSSKLAARHEMVNPVQWARHVAKLRRQEPPPTEPRHPTYRRSRATQQAETVKAAFEQNLVVITFDDTTVKLHYEEAFQLYWMLRNAARNAKNWAGDRSRQWSTVAHLSTAEANDKLIYLN